MTKATLLLELDEEQLSVLSEPSKREPVTCKCALEATLAMKAFGAKRHSRHSFCDRSRHWNG